jgi:hypothetical protein
MEIKITSTSDDLAELHQLLYDADNQVEVDEEYGPTEGFQKEPSVTALIVTIAKPTLLAIIYGFYKTRQTRIKAETEKVKIEKKAETDQLNIFLKANLEWKKLSIKELDKLGDLGDAKAKSKRKRIKK